MFLWPWFTPFLQWFKGHFSSGLGTWQIQALHSFSRCSSPPLSEDYSHPWLVYSWHCSQESDFLPPESYPECQVFFPWNHKEDSEASFYCLIPLLAYVEVVSFKPLVYIRHSSLPCSDCSLPPRETTGPFSSAILLTWDPPLAQQ